MQCLPGSIIGGGDEALVFSAVSNWFEGIRDLIKAFNDFTQHINGGSQFSSGIGGFHSGRSNSDIDALRADGMIEGYAGDVNV